MAEKNNKEKAIAVLESLGTEDKKAVKDWISSEKYIQHNLSFPDGKNALLIILDQMEGSIKVNVKRTIADGDYVALHSDVNFLGPKVSFDIFRFEKGKIVEHWDNLYEKVEKTASGHSMLDGSTEITDMDKTEANKALVKKFVEMVLIGGRYDQMSKYFDDDNYIQHSPTVPDKLSGLVNALKELAKQGGEMRYTKNHMILGEGNFVLAVSEGYLDGRYVAFYDLWRVENSKIAEHWDVVETVPPQEEWKNQNGKF